MSGPTQHSITLIESVPASLYDLLTREIAYQRVRSLLLKSLDDARRNLQALKATRPPFLILINRELKTSLSMAEDSVAMLEKGLSKLDEQEPKLNAFVSHRIENYLRKTSADYIRSLVEKRFANDWPRLSVQFEHYTAAFQGTLALLEATLAQLGPYQTLSMHPSCGPLLARAILTAKQFEAEIAFLNKIADAQSRQAGPEGFTLHRQLELDWSSALQSFAEEDGKSGPPALRQLLTQFHEVSQNARRAIRDECAPRTSPESEEPASYHALQWRLLRDAVQLRVNPQELDVIARETEFLLENGRIAEIASSQEEVRRHSITTTVTPAQSSAAKAAPPPRPKRESEPVLQLRTRRSHSTPPHEPPAPAATRTGDTPAMPELTAIKADLENEITRLRNEHQDLLARTQFIEESENKLLDKSQEQQEREVILEQRAEDLLSLEKRLREMYPQAAGAEPAVHAFDEFNE